MLGTLAVIARVNLKILWDHASIVIRVDGESLTRMVTPLSFLSRWSCRCSEIVAFTQRAGDLWVKLDSRRENCLLRELRTEQVSFVLQTLATVFGVRAGR